ncbi:MAG: hypothetical protein FD144_2635 [Rhodospirillaceae bacterium]|nr:MAG: hypothetical protein FD144_2635 [Rhodospirillaceae bacterium]
MSSRLTRRTLFALPIALPVAAVAAKVGAGKGVVLAEEVHVMRPVDWTKAAAFLREDRLRRIRDAGLLSVNGMRWLEGRAPIAVGLDAGGNDDKVAVAVQPAQPVVA